jgi:hypothetical protein
MVPAAFFVMCVEFQSQKVELQILGAADPARFPPISQRRAYHLPYEPNAKEFICFGH